MKKAQGQLHACRVFFSISGRMDMVLVLLESLKITMPHFESFGKLLCIELHSFDMVTSELTDTVI